MKKRILHPLNRSGDKDFAVEYGQSEYVHLTAAHGLTVYVNELEDGNEPTAIHYDGDKISLSKFRNLLGVR